MEGRTGQASIYDEVPYQQRTHPSLHPIRLATALRLAGGRPAPVESCRHLELGCGGAAQLIDLACTYAGSEFVGVELAAHHVESARSQIAQLGLTNLRIVAADFAEAGDDLGSFDYVAAHGLFSWVPPTHQELLLELCGAVLAPNGVAYVSYNAHPGWRIQQIIRDLLLREVAHIESPEQRVGAAKQLLGQFSQNVDTETPYGALLADRVKYLVKADGDYLYHDHLWYDNHPSYLAEVVEMASRHGLRYFDDLVAVGAPVFPRSGAPLTAVDVRDISYWDAVNGIQFRAGVFCRDGLVLSSGPRLEDVTRMWVAADVRVAATSGVTARHEFETPHGPLGTDDPLVAAALTILGERWPDSVRVGELVDRLCGGERPDAGTDSPAVRLIGQLLYLHQSVPVHQRAVELSTQRFPVQTARSDRPTVAASARALADRVGRIPNGRHLPVELGPHQRFFAPLCEGTRTVHDLAREVKAGIDRGDIVFHGEDGQPVDPADVPADSLDEFVDATLAEFLQQGLMR